MRDSKKIKYRPNFSENDDNPRPKQTLGYYKANKKTTL
jgi:hypothetical protein